MLDRLPTELLRDIIEATLPPERAFSRSKECNALLKSYCLVCHEVRKVAQPILQRIFRPRNGATRALAQPELVKNVRIFESMQSTVGFDDVFSALAKMKNVREVKLDGYEERINVKHLRILKDVEHLVLRTVTIDTRGLTFNNLTSLTLHRIAESRKGSLCLSPLDLPNLRALYTTSTYQDPDTKQPALLDFPELQFQLDFLQVHADNVEQFPSDLFHRDIPVLLTVTTLDGEAIDNLPLNCRPKHIQIELREHVGVHYLGDHGNVGVRCYQLLATLVQFVGRQPQLLSLCLPAVHHPSSATYYASWFDVFSHTCTNANVKILWRLFADGGEDDFGVSREFWAYAKELKAKKATNGNGGVSA